MYEEVVPAVGQTIAESIVRSSPRLAQYCRALLGLVVVPGLAVAQQPDAAARQIGALEEIIVSARKRAETTQDVPVAVVALSGEQLARADISSLERVAQSTPQLAIGRAASGSGSTIVLRGVGSNSTSIGLEQSVAVVVDGVYYGQGRVINEGFFDLGRLELLKGPQALFFGKNATAGVISITSNDPGDKLELIARAGYEVKARNVLGEFIVSGPVSDTLGVRLALRGSKMYGGYFTNRAPDRNWLTIDGASLVPGTTQRVPGTITNGLSTAADRHPGVRDLIGRLTVKWKPSDELTATLKGSVNDNQSDNPALNYVPFLCPQNGRSQRDPNLVCGRNWNIYQNNYRQDIADATPYSKSDGSLGNDYKAWALTGTLEYDLENINFTMVNNYQHNKNVFQCDCDVQSAQNLSIAANEPTTYWAWSSEFRALTEYDGPANLMLGGLYQKTKRDYRIFTESNGFENSLAPDGFRYTTNSKDSQTKGETLAVFGQLIVKPIEQVEVSAGVRYTHETKDSYFLQPYSHPLLTAAFPVGLAAQFQPGVRLTADQTFNDWSPEITVSFKPTSEINIYGGYKTAYKSGGFSNSGIHSYVTTVENDFAFDPEKARGFEGGIKTLLADRQLRLNLGLYRYKIKNQQVDFFNAPVFAFTTTNAGSTVSKGVELEFEYAPMQVEGLRLSGSVNYNKAYYSSFPNAGCWTGQSPALGCPVLPGLGRRQDLTGFPTAMAPRWTGSLGGSFDRPLTDRWDFGISVNARYSDDYLASAFGNPNSRQKSYVVLDAGLRVSSSDDQWEFAVIGKNLTNEWYMTGIQEGPSTGINGTGGVWLAADQIGYVNPPRTVQFQVTWRYQ